MIADSKDLESEVTVHLLPVHTSTTSSNEKTADDTWERRLSASRFPTSISKCAVTARDALTSGLLFFLPSFVASLLERKDTSRSSTSRTRPTAFLDGVRGLAAWAVFNLHLACAIYKDNGFGWGYRGAYYEVFRFPIVRLLYSGSFNVGLFFVLSGYALSVSFLKHARQTPIQEENMLRHFASAIFRRPIRLLLPAWASTTLAMILVRLRYMEVFHEKLERVFKGLIDGESQLFWLAPKRLDTLWLQIKDLCNTNVTFLQIFDSYIAEKKDFSYYNSNTWTIPLELRGSLILFLTQIMLCSVRPRLRSPVVLILIFLGIMAHSYEAPLFWSGYLIAKHSDLSKTASKKSILESIMWWIVFFVGCFIGSFVENEPKETLDTPIWSWMLHLSPFGFFPAFRFFTGLGSVLVLLAISKTSLLRSIYSTAPIQYLGRISFGLYLVQIWIINGVGLLIYYNVWTITGKDTLASHVFGFLVAYLLVFVLSVWVADLFWRIFDKPSVALGRALERWILVRDHAQLGDMSESGEQSKIMPVN